jgi:hypothetical protein
MVAITEYVDTEFEVFKNKPVQTGVLETVETWYNPIASVEQSDLKFPIHWDSETYVYLRIRIFVRGKLTRADGNDFEDKEHTTFTNNFLYSLISACKISLNEVGLTQNSDLFHYRDYIKNLLTYGSDASIIYLTNAFRTTTGSKYRPALLRRRIRKLTFSSSNVSYVMNCRKSR